MQNNRPNIIISGLLCMTHIEIESESALTKQWEFCGDVASHWCKFPVTKVGVYKDSKLLL